MNYLLRATELFNTISTPTRETFLITAVVISTASTISSIAALSLAATGVAIGAVITISGMTTEYALQGQVRDITKYALSALAMATVTTLIVVALTVLIPATPIALPISVGIFGSILVLTKVIRAIDSSYHEGRSLGRG